jgi:large subunit ribosomal protein L25
MREIQISVDPANIPNHIDVDVSNVTIGHPVHVADLKLPAGAVAIEEATATVFAVAAPRTHEETTAAPEAASAAEPEVIRAKKPEE